MMIFVQYSFITTPKIHFSPTSLYLPCRDPFQGDVRSRSHAECGIKRSEGTETENCLQVKLMGVAAICKIVGCYIFQTTRSFLHSLRVRPDFGGVLIYPGP